MVECSRIARSARVRKFLVAAPHDGLAIFAAALAVRLAVLADVRDAPFWRVPLVDETAYLDLARGLLAGVPPAHGAWYVAPGYAYFLALVFASGGGMLAVKLLQLLAGACSAALVWRLARRVGGRRSALAAGLGFALYPAALLQEVLLLKSELTLFFLLLLLVLLVPAGGTHAGRSSAAGELEVPPGAPASRRGDSLRWLAAGACCGAAAVLRGELALVALGLAVAGWIARARRWPGAPPRIAPALFAAAVGLAIAGPTAQNYLRSGDLVLVAYGGGPNFYIGNHAGADGSYVPLRPDRFDPRQEEADAVLLASQALGHPASPAAVSRYWWRQGFEWWRREPARAAALALKKLMMLWGPWELADVLSTELAGRWVVLLRNRLVAAPVVLPAALVGLWITRRRRDLWPLHAFLVGAQLAIVPFFLFERFRLHLVAVCVPFAAASGERAWALGRARRWRALGAGLLATAGLAGLLALARAPRDEIVLCVNLGEMLFQSGRYPEARQEFEAVRIASPSAWRVDLNIANTEVALGHPDAALVALGRLLPRLHAEGARTGLPSVEELVYGHELAGDLEHDRGHQEAAAAHYDQALRLATPAAQPALGAKLAACRGAGAAPEAPVRPP